LGDGRPDARGPDAQWGEQGLETLRMSRLHFALGVGKQAAEIVFIAKTLGRQPAGKIHEFLVRVRGDVPRDEKTFRHGESAAQAARLGDGHEKRDRGQAFILALQAGQCVADGRG